tara:strand:+ start:1377 stop:1553 length:177 start_codon:yes stop_codon:yes gene_type:complete
MKYYGIKKYVIISCRNFGYETALWLLNVNGENAPERNDIKVGVMFMNDNEVKLRKIEG